MTSIHVHVHVHAIHRSCRGEAALRAAALVCASSQTPSGERSRKGYTERFRLQCRLYPRGVIRPRWRRSSASLLTALSSCGG